MGDEATNKLGFDYQVAILPRLIFYFNAYTRVVMLMHIRELCFVEVEDGDQIKVRRSPTSWSSLLSTLGGILPPALVICARIHTGIPGPVGVRNGFV